MEGGSVLRLCGGAARRGSPVHEKATEMFVAELVNNWFIAETVSQLSLFFIYMATEVECLAHIIGVMSWVKAIGNIHTSFQGLTFSVIEVCKYNRCK